MPGTPFDFLLERRPASIGGRRYLVSKPTVETVLSAIALFYPELCAIANKIGDGSESSPEAIARALVAVGRDRAARVLATCVSVTGHDRGDVEEFIASDLSGETAVALALCVVSLCNIERIVADLNLSGESGEAGVSFAPLPIVVSVVRISEDMGLNPLHVMDWPYEALLTVMETKQYLALPPDQRPGRMASADELSAVLGG